MFIMLWFDVGIKRYTTSASIDIKPFKLWFDVGIKRYTTTRYRVNKIVSCGLM